MESSVVSGEPHQRPGLLESVWVRGALVVAAVEAILIVVGVIPRWLAVAVAAAALAAYFLWGRRVTQPSTRQTFWAIALSQALVLFVPLILWILGAFVIIGLAVLAAIVLVALVADR